MTNETPSPAPPVIGEPTEKTQADRIEEKLDWIISVLSRVLKRWGNWV